MIKRAALVLFELAGSPAQDGCADLDAPARCRVCAGMTERAMPYERWQGATFTDQNKLRYIAGVVTCEACVWAHAWVPPPGWVPTAADLEKKAAKRAAIEAELAKSGKKAGVERPPNLRLFSHLYDGRGYTYANKADKALIREWLCAPKRAPWFCAIADSGQKHVLPWTPINLDGHVGVVRFEETDVFVDSRLLSDFLDAACSMLTAGATKAELESGTYRADTWLRCGEETIRAFERRFGAERGGGLFSLVVWLAQRDEDAVAARLDEEKARKAAKKEAKKNGRGTAGSAARRGRGSDDGDAGRVPRGRSKRADTLGAPSRSGAPGGEDERASDRVDHGVPPPAEPGGAGQLDLFGGAGA